MVDCGVSFDEPLKPAYKGGTELADRFSVVAPDPTFIAAQKERLSGLVITHAHEDHVGAVAHLWPRLQCPVYTTAFTAEVLRRKLAQEGLVDKVPVIIVDPGAIVQLGPFSVRWLAITHSIPDPYALLITTAAGSVLHTADWKIDAQPITGKGFNNQQYKSLGQQKLLALVGDSTNALKPGFSLSERTCYDGLLATIKPLKGRVVVACFGSNIARLISLARIAAKTGRYMALLGRSLVNMMGVARHCDIWPSELEVIDAHHIGYLPPEEVLVVATGSQGEPRAAMHRLAIDNHSLLSLDKGDTVIFSSIVIPGNETSVATLIQRLTARNISVIESADSALPIHASGHPCAEELRLMYNWVKPELAIPVHGEAAHLQAHADIARECGVRKTYVGENGDLYLLAPHTGIRRQVVKTGRLPIRQS